MSVTPGRLALLNDVVSAALNLCDNGMDECRKDGRHMFDACDVKALNDALDALLEAEAGEEEKSK